MLAKTNLSTLKPETFQEKIIAKRLLQVTIKSAHEPRLVAT
jgi:hypothetical protein